MKHKWITMSLETKSREYHSRLLLAYHLVRKGYGVIITNNIFNLRYTNRYPRGLYIIINAFHKYHKPIKYIKKKKNCIYLLDEEGLLYISNATYKKRIHYDNISLIDKVLCWGKNQYKTLLSLYPEYEYKYTITGNPRINLLNSKFSNLYISKNNNTDIYNPYILIVSNFANVNRYIYLDNNEKQYGYLLEKAYQLNLVNSEEEEKIFLERYIFSYNIFKSMKNMILSLSKMYKNINFVIRPHPSEEDTLWKELEKKSKNIHIIYEGAVTQWINGAEMIIQNSCTSSIESLFLNKYCISYRPYTSIIHEQPLPKVITQNAYSTEEVEKAISLLQEGDKTNYYGKYVKLINNYVSYYKEDESVKNIVNLIEKENLESIKYNKRIYYIKSLYITNIIRNITRITIILTANIMHKIMKKLNCVNNNVFILIDKKVDIRKKNKIMSNKKLGYISIKNSAEILKKYKLVYGDDINIKIEKVDRSTLIITLKE